MKTCRKDGGIYQDSSNYCLICGDKLVQYSQEDGKINIQPGRYSEGKHYVDRDGKLFKVVCINK